MILNPTFIIFNLLCFYILFIRATKRVLFTLAILIKMIDLMALMRMCYQLQNVNHFIEFFAIKMHFFNLIYN